MEIKFKAYIKSLGWVVDVERINFDCKTIEVDLSAGQGDTTEYDFDEVELLQYTGLKDKEGKEICKGDILLTNDEEFGENYSWIEFKDGAFVVKEKNCTDTMLLSELLTLEPKLVGNIYENLELLRGEE